MSDPPTATLNRRRAPQDLLLSARRRLLQRLGSLTGSAFLLLVASSSVLAVLFILFFIAKGALPFFQLRGFSEFLTSARWYPTAEPAEFGALSLFVGSGLVTLGSAVVAVPLGITAAVCLSDVLPFSVRQVVKPVIEVLAAIPSVAFGFFALVVFAPMLQDYGGRMLAVGGHLIRRSAGSVPESAFAPLPRNR